MNYLLSLIILIILFIINVKLNIETFFTNPCKVLPFPLPRTDSNSFAAEPLGARPINL